MSGPRRLSRNLLALLSNGCGVEWRIFAERFPMADKVSRHIQLSAPANVFLIRLGQIRRYENQFYIRVIALILFSAKICKTVKMSVSTQIKLSRLIPDFLFQKIQNSLLVLLGRGIVCVSAKCYDHVFCLKNKKCAAEATHEKRITPLLRHKFFPPILESTKKRACIFTEVKIMLSKKGLIYSLVSQHYCTTKHSICKHFFKKNTHENEKT